MSTIPMVRCVDCNGEEREVWARADKHVCGKITDPLFPVTRDMTIRIGKYRFINIKVK